VSESKKTNRRSTDRRRWVYTGITLAALAACWASFDQLADWVSPPAAPSALSPRVPVHSPNADKPIEVSEERGPALGREWQERVVSPTTRGLVASLATRAALARPMRAGVFSEPSCCDEPGPLTRILESIPACKWQLATAAEIQANRLDHFDVLIVPGGRGHRQAAALGEEGRRVVRDFVRAGGGFVGICAGGFLASAQYDWSLGLVNTRILTGDREMPGVGIKSMADRGPGTAKIALTDAGRAVFGDIVEPINVGFAGGPIFVGPKGSELPAAVRLAFFRNELINYEPQRGTMIDTPSILASRFGAGIAIVISPHPETTQGVEFLVRRSVIVAARKQLDQSVGDADTEPCGQQPRKR
jgi:glutamine amidotransferase-like uncharacterized protein